MYPPEMVAPMKADLTEAGFSELITEADVDTALSKEGTTLVVLNSVCGCAAGSMRPGVKLAVKHNKVPTNLHRLRLQASTVKPLTAPANSCSPTKSPAMRGFFTVFIRLAWLQIVQGRPFGGHGGASCSISRLYIEGRTAEMIADHLKMAFDEFC